MTKNFVGWFEIPVNNMERAIKFYQTVFNTTLTRHKMGPVDMAWFPWHEDEMGAAGSLVDNSEHYKPSTEGVLIYFTTQSGDMDGELALVEKAGGKILRNKKLINEEIGYEGLFIDSEGNRIAIHSRIDL